MVQKVVGNYHVQLAHGIEQFVNRLAQFSLFGALRNPDFGVRTLGKIAVPIDRADAPGQVCDELEGDLRRARRLRQRGFHQASAPFQAEND